MITPSKVGHALGWFSIALGLSELLGGNSIARFLGTDDSANLVLGFGLRELGSGAGILASTQPEAGWLWTRVVGDALDLAALAAALRTRGARRANIELSLGAVAAVTALDLWCALKLAREQSPKALARA